MAARTALVLLAVGLLLIVLSVVWQQDLGFNRGYTDEDAMEYAQASSDLHAAMDAMDESSHSHEESEAHEHADLAGAQARFDAVQARRDQALESRAMTSWLMKWGGLALTLTGAVTLWLKRE